MPARLCAIVLAATAVGTSFVALGPGSAAASAVGSTITGTIVAVHPADFIVRTPGSTGAKLNELVSYADQLEARNYPYVYGGGHGTVGAELQVGYTEAEDSTIRAASVKNIGGRTFNSTASGAP